MGRYIHALIGAPCDIEIPAFSFRGSDTLEVAVSNSMAKCAELGANSFWFIRACNVMPAYAYCELMQADS